MSYKNYNVFSDELKQKIKNSNLPNPNPNLKKQSELIRKSMHYTKRVDAKNIAQVLKAGATPNKHLFDAIVRFYDN